MTNPPYHRKLYKFLTLALLLLCTAVPASADELSEFEAYKKQQQAGAQQGRREFHRYRDEIRAAFEQYRKKTAAIWGRDNIMPARNNWISFQDDIRQRSVVDFEKGRIKVEIALDNDQPADDSTARRRLEENIRKLLTQVPDTRSMPELARHPAIDGSQHQERHGRPVLQNLVADERGHEVNPQDYRKLAADLASKARKKTIVGEDGRRRTVYEAQFRMVPDHIKRRASIYQHQVNQNAGLQKLPPELVFAVIETESWFNPTARSPAPAFGLMQLVPDSGARDAYKKLYNKDRIVSDRYLYNPENNIRLGTAYLNLLYYRYFEGIDSPQSRLWATIAAYNTGAGNVFRTFAGRYKRSTFGNRSRWKAAALREINRRTPEQVYQFMKAHLPYRETRDYIVKVRQRMPKYRGDMAAQPANSLPSLLSEAEAVSEVPGKVENIIAAKPAFARWPAAIDTRHP